MTSLLLRNLIFTILQPGIVAGVISYLIVSTKWDSLFNSLGVSQYIGLLIFVIGLVLMLYCIYQFAIDGKGTLSPVDPTQKLVIKGLYQYTRNPMYVGVMLILLGEAIFSRSFWMWGYGLLVFLGFNLFIIFVEEPRLKRDFWEEYSQYCKNVRRWI